MKLALVVLAACSASAAPAARVVDAGAGWRFGCALLDDTTVRCFGEGIEGSVGDGTGYDRNRPVPVIYYDSHLGLQNFVKTLSTIRELMLSIPPEIVPTGKVFPLE